METEIGMNFGNRFPPPLTCRGFDKIGISQKGSPERCRFRFFRFFWFVFFLFPVFFRALPFLSVSIFFLFLLFFSGSGFSICFRFLFPFSSLSFSEKRKTGRYRSRDPFAKPRQNSFEIGALGNFSGNFLLIVPCSCLGFDHVIRGSIFLACPTSASFTHCDKTIHLRWPDSRESEP